ncbi:acyl-CoA carboxylase epsilon subunit [Streptomyces sp. NPDC059862]|uniref:acyl-CoA carboxylase epsilon subunit n=1 Tax=unclassified Streptomyces TaxID=2593676 RepID=UPI00362BC054
MSGREGESVLIRVERGEGSEEELAALTLVLLAVYGQVRESDGKPSPVGWRWWQRNAHYRAPAGWR